MVDSKHGGGKLLVGNLVLKDDVKEDDISKLGKANQGDVSKIGIDKKGEVSKFGDDSVLGTDLKRALNAVWFGHFRVRASVAKFERNDSGSGRRLDKKNDFLLKDEKHNASSAEKEISEPMEGVRVGGIDVKIGAHNVKKKVQKAGDAMSPKGDEQPVDTVKEGRILMRSYRSKPEDAEWAQNGIVATVFNGEAISVVQNRILDAGFSDLVLIPLGADIVFVRSSEGVDALSTVNNAKEFFKLVFSNWTRWDKDVLTYRRGAWVRLYGIPLHAWNEHFFKLCVHECGRFLRTDYCSAEKERLDFARVLIATPNLDIIKRVEIVLVDGIQVKVTIAEEWGYAMGEDHCLFEEETESDAAQSDCGEADVDPEVRRNVDILVNNITDGIEDENCDDFSGMRNVESLVKPMFISPCKGKTKEEVERRPDTYISAETSSNLRPGTNGASGVQDLRGAQVCHSAWPLRTSRTNSCPPKASRSVISGSWSLEWLQDQNHRDAGVIFSASKKRRKGIYHGKRPERKEQNDCQRRKAGGDGVNRSCTLSRQASAEDSSSSGSVNNDWKNWVAVQGNDQMAVDDVWGIGKAIGVKFKGDNVNMFNLLSRASKGKKENLDHFMEYSRAGVFREEEGSSSSFGFSYRPSVGASGGLLTLWDSTEVKVWSTESREHVLWCHGRFSKTGEEFLVANVYAPCDDGAKQILWDSLTVRLLSLVGKMVARVRGLSDHCPLILSANEEDWGPRPSRMLKCWKDVPGYNLFVREKWNSLQVDGWGGYVLKEKFKLIKTSLKEWHTTHTQNLPSRIETLKVKLSALDEKGEENDLSEEELVEFHGISSDIHSLSRLHASISWQQSRSQWLKDDDANSRYFHSILAGRRRRNVMTVIQVDGVTLEGVAPIKQAVFSHFESHFKASNVERPRVDDLQFKRLNQVESGSLIKPFTEAEVRSAVWDCDSYKSPGPDGINFGFIKDFWVELKGDIMRFLSEFHRNGKLTKGINSTFIALIPKVDSPQKLNDFRPISLVGSLYKILAKVLANRLRLVIGSLISESQTAFVKDRQILDGILIANEVVDEARKSKKELMLFKVDFEKAYDSVDWGYLDDVMGRMSFPSLWRKWIRECVCTATASVLVNGSPTDEFPLGRGLRQGDPLSPFLFLLAAEGFNVLMEAMVARNLFTGYNIGGEGQISVSHLQFADDTLLMGVKSWANVRALRAVLVLFETLSGLKVNFNKSMLVRVNIPDSWLGEAASVLCCNVGKIPFLYLGLQIGGDPRRLSFWEPVLIRIKNRLSGWKSRFLSFGGRLVLLKSVLTSLPVYALSFFKAPSGTISSIESLFTNFFFLGGCEDSRKISWVSWKSICLNKESGGLGVRRLREFNQALLGKWCWRMLVDREGFWFRVLAARYGVEGGRLREGGRKGSVWWREIARIRERGGESGVSWFREHVLRRVGDGSDTFYWTDLWVDGVPLCERFGRLFQLAETKSRTVAEMFALGWGEGGEAWEWRR
ncbi:cysteine-rich receptor-like protein kinase, partial [Trifolium pratense]